MSGVMASIAMSSSMEINQKPWLDIHRRGERNGFGWQKLLKDPLRRWLQKRGAEPNNVVVHEPFSSSEPSSYGKFNKALHERDEFLWTKCISEHAHGGRGREAIRLYKQMREEGVLPKSYTFVAALKACSTIADLAAGKEIHAHVIQSGFETSVFVASMLVDMYAKCGSIHKARLAFEAAHQRDVALWSTMIVSYVNMNMEEAALLLYSRMLHEGFQPNSRTFVAVLKACGTLAAQEEGSILEGRFVKLRCLQMGRGIHTQVIWTGLESSVYVANALLGMYAKCGSMPDARRVFENTAQRNLVSWNAMIMEYAQLEMGELALQLYVCMQHEGFAPNARTFVAVLKACGSLAAQEEGREIDGECRKNKCLEIGRAIHSQVARDGLESDIFVASTLVDMYAKCGSMQDAQHVFDRMPHRDVVSWTAIIMAYTQMEMGEQALKLFARMQNEGFVPDYHCFVAALLACGSVASLETGKKFHAQIESAGLEGDAFVASALIDMYSKCGSMVDAQELFDSLPVRYLVTWNALIAGYSGQGESERVFSLLLRMQEEGIQPADITFVSVLRVCSYAGLVHKGQKYFQAMCSEYEVIPTHEHYQCMSDLLGRAGQLDEAVAFIKKMPFKPNKLTWLTILGSCRKWNRVAMGRQAFECVMRLDQKQASAYVLMANIYASADLLKESAEIQEMRNIARAWKNLGQCKWTDDAGIVHTFKLGDRSHKQIEDIYAKLKELSVKLEKVAHVPNLGSMLQHLLNDGRGDELCGHSEKLAISCALINTTPGAAIRIVKNLRVCVDCHNLTGIISKIERRTIICRDAICLHVYKDGKCCCGEFI